MATVFESRFCRFELPAGWMVLPGLGAMETRASAARQSAVVLENWLEEATTAETFGKRQREFLARERPGISLIEEKPLSGAAFRDARWVALRAPGAGGVTLRQEQIFAIEGPLAVSLTLTASEKDPEKREKSFETVRRSFEIRHGQTLRQLKREALIAGEPPAPAPARTSVPHLQIALPVPAGWRLDVSTGTLVSSQGAEISIVRSGLPANAPDELFAEALAAALRDSAVRPRFWDHGPTAQGFEAYALESAAVATGTWVQKEAAIRREVYVQDAGAVVFRLKASDGDRAAKAALAQVVGGYELLPPADRRLRVTVPWLPVELSGPWQAGGPGIFVRAALPSLTLTAMRMPAIQGAEKFAAAAADALKPAAPGVRVAKEERKQASWKGITLYRYAVDAVAPDGEKTSTRATWFASGDSVCFVIVRGSEAEAEPLFGQCLDQLRPGESEPRKGEGRSA